MLDFIAMPLGTLLHFMYDNLAFQNYGLAIIEFTILIKFILLPLTIKQSKSIAKTRKLQPKIKELQQRFKNDKARLNQELAKFYQENGFNPLSGCLPMLIQLPILFALLYVVGKPLTYMLGYSASKIAQLASTVPATHAIKGFYQQLGAVNYHNILNMNFLGINLGYLPSYSPSKLFGSQSFVYLVLFIIPLLAAWTTYLTGKLSLETTPSKSDDNDSFSQTQKTMTYMMPLMTLIFSFQFPASLGLYWIVGNVFQIFQQKYINKHILAEGEVVK